MISKNTELSKQLKELTQLSQPLKCSAPQEAVNRSPIKILYIEDDSIDQQYFCRLVTKNFQNVSVTCIDRPPKDLSVLDEYDAILLDENLGAEKGMDFARRVHAYNWIMPKALITGHDLDAPMLLDSKSCVDANFSKSPKYANKLLISFSAFIRRIVTYQLLKLAQSKI